MRKLYVDASVCITLAEIDYLWLLRHVEGTPIVPDEVVEEVSEDPGASRLNEALNEGWLNHHSIKTTTATLEVHEDAVGLAAQHLGVDEDSNTLSGDVALLALGISTEDCVVLTDDKPLRKTCKTLGIDISGSIGVLVAAVKRGVLEVDEAKDALVAMDEVGARLSARLLRKAERLIDEAAKEGQ